MPQGSFCAVDTDPVWWKTGSSDHDAPAVSDLNMTKEQLVEETSLPQ